MEEKIKCLLMPSVQPGAHRALSLKMHPAPGYRDGPVGLLFHKVISGIGVTGTYAFVTLFQEKLPQMVCIPGQFIIEDGDRRALLEFSAGVDPHIAFGSGFPPVIDRIY